MHTATIEFESLEENLANSNKMLEGAPVPKLKLPSLGLGKLEVSKKSENPFVIPLNSERMLMHKEFERLSEVRLNQIQISCLIVSKFKIS